MAMQTYVGKNALIVQENHRDSKARGPETQEESLHPKPTLYGDDRKV